jgi:hypothetical protein
MNPGDVIWLRYVRHSDVADYEARGWAFWADLGRHHGVYSIMMEWAGEGPPR